MNLPDDATVLDLLRVRADTHRDQAAVVFEGQSLTCGELWSEIERVAAALIRHSLARGGRVVLVFPNELDFFGAFFGIQLAGGVAVPLYPDSGPGRVTDIAEQCGAEMILISSLVPEAVHSEIKQICPGPSPMVLSVADCDGAPPKVGLEPPDLQSLAYLQYTSGSTGDPKGVMISQHNVIANVRQMATLWNISSDDVFVSWLPMWHDMGLILMTMAPLVVGAKLIIMPTSVAGIRRWMSVIAEHRGTFTAAPDFAYRIALRASRKESEFDLSSLRFALNAAEPVRPTTIAEFEAHFGLDQTLVPAYGLAEATAGVAGRRSHQPAKIDHRGLVSVGRPMPEINVEIIGDGGPLGSNEIGEIVFSSPAGTSGYFRNPKATAKLHTATGAIRTGDMGYLDTDGELFIVGRTKSIIIQAGRTIAPQEIEETVDRLDFVRRTAAIGIDRGGIEGEQAWVFAEIRPGGPTDKDDYGDMVVEIVRAVHTRLGSRPGRVYLLHPRSIPMTHNGKVQHLQMRLRYLDGSLRGEGRIIYPEH